MPSPAASPSAAQPSHPGAASRWKPRLHLTTVVSLVLGVGYFAISRGFQNFYPFSIVDMYAERHEGSPSRIMALDARGRAHEVTEYVGWQCEGPLSDGSADCPTGPEHILTIGYVDRSAIEHVEAHPGRGPAGEPVQLVRRVWRLSSRSGPPSHADCLMVQCRAVRR